MSKRHRKENRDASPKSKRLAEEQDPLSSIKIIVEKAEKVAIEVDNFKGKSCKDREFIRLDGLIAFHISRLDGIESEGNKDVREARKKCVVFLQNCAKNLEEKISEVEHIVKILEDAKKIDVEI